MSLRSKRVALHNTDAALNIMTAVRYLHDEALRQYLFEEAAILALAEQAMAGEFINTHRHKRGLPNR